MGRPPGQYNPGGRHGGAGHSQYGNRQMSVPDQTFVTAMNGIDLRSPRAETFDTIASDLARMLEEEGGGKINKSSQLRRFYDQIIRFSEDHQPTEDKERDEERFSRALPFVRMLSAHAKYAETRKKVGPNFVAFMQIGMRKVSSAEDLRMFRTLFEAVIGFMPKED